jgi:hypothetical protein
MTFLRSIRQPWAELIVRGIKTIEVRSKPARVRGRVFFSPSLGWIEADEEAEVRRDHGVEADGCPRGVLVGTFEIVGCHALQLSDSADRSESPIRSSRSAGFGPACRRRGEDL